MNDWTSGYVADIDYTYGYYQELNPLRSAFGLTFSGIKAPKIRTACELGFGQGISTNLHAAATDIEWWGTDFNPAQAGFARELAETSGANCHLFDESFEDFCSRDDLPGFDYIGLHGIWSWISDENRELIARFIRNKLNVGGVLYMSYNTQPGWANFIPLRHLLTLHAGRVGSGGLGTASKVEGSLKFMEELLAIDPMFAKLNPNSKERFNKLTTQDRHYLAHEYFNKDWQPMHFAETASILRNSKVDFACSANFLDYFDSVNLQKPQREMLSKITDPILKQSIFDFTINQTFRKDYWVRGPRKISNVDKALTMRDEEIVLASHAPDISLKFPGAQGEVTMNESVYKPILSVLQDHKPLTILELMQEAGKEIKDLKLGTVLEAVFILASKGHVVTTQEQKSSKTVKAQCKKLNDHLVNLARKKDDINWLASPLTGGGHHVPRFQQLFLLARRQGATSVEDMANSVMQVLKANGEKIVKDDKALETAEENLTELRLRSEEFANKYLPILQALKIE